MASDWNLYLDKLLAAKLTVAEHRLALAFGRLLLGWNRRRAELGREVLCEAAGLDRRDFRRALVGLANKGLVSVVDAGRRGRGNRATYELSLGAENDGEERPFLKKKKDGVGRHLEGRENDGVHRLRKERTQTVLRPSPPAAPTVKTIQVLVIEAYCGAGGSLELDEWRGPSSSKRPPSIGEA